MAAVETLPIAQPAARPETAAARKPVSAPSETGKTSFADMIDAEVDADIDAKEDTGGATEAAAADPAAVPAQPAPAATAPVVNVQAAVLAVLQTIVVPQVESPADAIEVPGLEVAAAPAPVPAAVASAASPDSAIATAAAPDAVQPAAPVSVETAIPIPAAPVADAAMAAAAPAIAATAVEAVVAIPATAPGAPKAVSPATKDKAPLESSSSGAEAPVAADAPDAPAPASATADTAPVLPAAAQAAVLVQAATPTLPAPKLAVPAMASEASPGSRRAANRADVPVAAIDTTATNIAQAKPASSGVTPVAAATAQANAQAQASATAADATPDIKRDAPAASSTASTSFADALSAARPQTSDAGRAQSVSPQLQSAPAAAIQVYTRFVERFDGRAQRFEVRLDPAELGRVDVRIEIGADKKVHAVLAAHDSAALTDLMRGQRSLERALNDAGIDLADGGLRFELSDNSGRNLTGGEQRGESGSDDQLAHAWRAFSTVDVGVDAEAAQAATARPYSWRTSRLDLVA